MGYQEKLPQGLEPNQLLDVELLWADKGCRKVALTVTGIQGVIDEHAQPTPHAGVSRLTAIKYQGQQIWP